MFVTSTWLEYAGDVKQLYENTRNLSLEQDVLECNSGTVHLRPIPRNTDNMTSSIEESGCPRYEKINVLIQAKTLVPGPIVNEIPSDYLTLLSNLGTYATAIHDVFSDQSYSQAVRLDRFLNNLHQESQTKLAHMQDSATNLSAQILVAETAKNQTLANIANLYNDLLKPKEMITIDDIYNKDKFNQIYGLILNHLGHGASFGLELTSSFIALYPCLALALAANSLPKILSLLHRCTSISCRSVYGYCSSVKRGFIRCVHYLKQ